MQIHTRNGKTLSCFRCNSENVQRDPVLYLDTIRNAHDERVEGHINSIPLFRIPTDKGSEKE